MKIAFVGLKGIPVRYGGVQRSIQEISERLAKKGHQVTVYCRSYYTPEEAQNLKGVNLIRIKGIKSRLLDTISHTFLSILKAIKQDYDIISVVNLGNAWLALLPKLFGKKVACHLHALEWEQRQKWNKLEQIYFISCIYALKLFSIPTTTVSPIHQEILKKDFNFITTHINNGLNKNDQVVTSSYNGFLKKHDYILCVSRLVPQKGIEYLIDAFKQVETPKKLIIAGDTTNHYEYKDSLLAQAGGDPRIVFLGSVDYDALQWLYHSAYLIILPSETEAMPNTLLEAIANEAAIVASDIPIHRLVTGGQIEFFPSKNSDRLKESLVWLLNNENKRNSLQAAVKNMKTRLPDWEKITELYEQFFLEHFQPI